MRTVNHNLLIEIEKSLPKLSKLLQKDIKYSVTFFVELVFDRNNAPHLKLNSSPIDPELFGVFITGIRSASINSFGYLTMDENALWFAPHLRYTHYSFGTNGFQMCYKNGVKLLYSYNFKNKKWNKAC